MAKIELEMSDELCDLIAAQKEDLEPIISAFLTKILNTVTEVRQVLKDTTKDALTVGQISRRIGYRKILDPVPTQDYILIALRYLKSRGKAIDQKASKAAIGKMLKSKGNKVPIIVWRKTNALERLAGID